MEWNQFIKKIEEEVQFFMGETATVGAISVMKNNGVMLQGIIIKEEGMNAGPTIYLNDYYEALKEGRQLQEIVSDIMAVYENNKIQDHIDISFFSDFARVKDRISCKLIQYEQNKELLEQVPYMHFLDLAIVFYYPFESEVLKNAAILIYHKYLKQWEITTEELYAIAAANTPRIMPPQIQHIDDMMKEMFAYHIEKDWQDSISRNLYPKQEHTIEINNEWTQEVAGQMMEALQTEGERIPMYVLSNQERIYGATCVLYPGLLEEFSKELGCSLWILPSSVHEVILIPDQGGEDVEKLKKMVSEINRTQVEEEEVLSDSVYYFDQLTKKIDYLT